MILVHQKYKIIFAINFSILLSQYCNCLYHNMELFFITIATLNYSLVLSIQLERNNSCSLYLCLIVVSFFSIYSYCSSSYCPSNSWCSFTLLKMIEKSKKKSQKSQKSNNKCFCNTWKSNYEKMQRTYVKNKEL